MIDVTWISFHREVRVGFFFTCKLYKVRQLSSLQLDHYFSPDAQWNHSHETTLFKGGFNKTLTERTIQTTLWKVSQSSNLNTLIRTPWKQPRQQNQTIPWKQFYNNKYNIPFSVAVVTTKPVETSLFKIPFSCRNIFLVKLLDDWCSSCHQINSLYLLWHIRLGAFSLSNQSPSEADPAHLLRGRDPRDSKVTSNLRNVCHRKDGGRKEGRGKLNFMIMHSRTYIIRSSWLIAP